MNKNEMLTAIRRADEAYYRDSNPVMTDAEYDKLRYDFIRLYGEDELGMPDVTDKSRKTFRHSQKALSLDKVKADEPDKLKAWLAKIAPEGEEAVIMKKYDGSRLIIYGDKVVGRGSGGIEGEVYEHFMSRYPLEKNRSAFPVSGEVLLTKKDFSEINAELESRGERPFKNIRNAASGILRSKERSPFLDRLTFVAYDLMNCSMRLTEKLAYIRDNTPFDAAPFWMASAADAVGMIPALFEKFCDGSEPEPVDGVVVKTNLPDSIRKFGETNHHYLDGFAWKPFMDGEETILRNVRWQVGRSRVTAVAEFDPVEIDGTTVIQASVSNAGIIRKLGLTIGAKILVAKANMIIPQVVQVLADGSAPVEIPDICPCCGKPLEMHNDVLFCTNENCGERLVQDIDYIGSKKVLDIQGLSESTIRKAIDAGLIREPYDILTLGEESIMSLEGFKEKSAKKLAEAILKSRQGVSLPKYVAACCVSGIGITIGEALSAKYGSYAKLLAALENGDDFSSIEGIGKANDELLHSSKFVSNFRVLHELIQPDEFQSASAGSSPVFVITGKLSKPRSYFEEYIKAHGGKVAGSVSKNTSFLLCEDSNSQSTKAKKARTLGIRVIGEKDIDSVL